MNGFTPAIMAEDVAALRRHAGAVLTFFVSTLQVRIDGSNGEVEPRWNEEILLFFLMERDYISLRLECGYSMQALIQEIVILRSAMHGCLNKLSETKEIKIEEIIALNALLDQFVDHAIEHYTNASRISKQRFISTINHDTRSPLFATSLGISLLLNDRQLSENSSKVVTLVSKNTEVAVSRISDYCDYNAIESGQRLSLSLSVVDLVAICGEVVQEIELLFPEYLITCNFQKSVNSNCDRIRTQQAIYIVLLNAIQNVHSCNEINLRVSAAGNFACVEIQNVTGQISREIRRVIYNPVMLNAIRSTQKIYVKEGERNRIGLYLAREILVSQGGTLTINQIGDKGVQFSIELPQLN